MWCAKNGLHLEETAPLWKWAFSILLTLVVLVEDPKKLTESEWMLDD